MEGRGVAGLERQREQECKMQRQGCVAKLKDPKAGQCGRDVLVERENDSRWSWKDSEVCISIVMSKWYCIYNIVCILVIATKTLSPTLTGKEKYPLRGPGSGKQIGKGKCKGEAKSDPILDVRIAPSWKKHKFQHWFFRRQKQGATDMKTSCGFADHLNNSPCASATLSSEHRNGVQTRYRIGPSGNSSSRRKLQWVKTFLDCRNCA